MVMMGGLHIEVASLKMVGHWLNNSRWDSALVQADVTTRGRADSILKAAHITRSRYAHQMSACTRWAYKAAIDNNRGPEDFTTWVQSSAQNTPGFFSGLLCLNWNY